MMGLPAYLVLGALVFSIGLFGVLTRRNAVGILLGIELMLNARQHQPGRVRALQRGPDGGWSSPSSRSPSRSPRSPSGLAIVIRDLPRPRTVEADRLDLLRG